MWLLPCQPRSGRRLPSSAQGDGEVKRREEQRRKQQAPTSTLFVVNFDVTRVRESDLAHEFNKYGRTKRVQIKKNFAFIQVSFTLSTTSQYPTYAAHRTTMPACARLPCCKLISVQYSAAINRFAIRAANQGASQQQL